MQRCNTVAPVQTISLKWNFGKLLLPTCPTKTCFAVLHVYDWIGYSNSFITSYNLTIHWGIWYNSHKGTMCMPRSVWASIADWLHELCVFPIHILLLCYLQWHKTLISHLLSMYVSPLKLLYCQVLDDTCNWRSWVGSGIQEHRTPRSSIKECQTTIH